MQNPPAATDLARFARDVAGEFQVLDTVERIVEQARRALGSDHAGITIPRSGGKLTSAVTSDPIVVEAAGLQFQLAEGPCIDAFSVQRLVYSPDVRADHRWPRWGPRAAGLGVRSALSAQLYTPNRKLGALNLYSKIPGQFTAEDAGIADMFAAFAAVALAAANEAESLHAAVANRTVIGQAQGLLMQQYRITADQAFAVLRRHSQDSNQKLYVVAEQIVGHHENPRSGAPGPVQAAHQAGVRAAELEQRRTELQRRGPTTPADVAAAQRAADEAKQRAAAASERTAERRMRAAMRCPRDIATTHAAIARLYRHLAHLDAAHRAAHQQQAYQHDTAARNNDGAGG